MKGIYLAAFKAMHKDYDIKYQDINGKRDIGGDMLEIDLSPYDFIIASPPCNYWSKANPYYKKSEYSLNTRHLLPCILEKLGNQQKPFLVENVRNLKRFRENGIIDICDKLGIFIYTYGRHTYFTNIMFNPNNIPQKQDFKNRGIYIGGEKNRQGGSNVHNVIEYWLKVINCYF